MPNYIPRLSEILLAEFKLNMNVVHNKEDKQAHNLIYKNIFTFNIPKVV